MEISNTALSQISNLAKMQLIAEQEVAQVEAELRLRKEHLRHVQEDLLPQAMAEAGMRSFVLETGEKITIKEDMTLSIPKENKAAALCWLAENGCGDLLKHTVSVDFGKGEDAAATQFLERCTAAGYHPVEKEDVNSATLKAFVKESLSRGVDMPLELFGAFPFTKAIIKTS